MHHGLLRRDQDEDDEGGPGCLHRATQGQSEFKYRERANAGDGALQELFNSLFVFPRILSLLKIFPCHCVTAAFQYLIFYILSLSLTLGKNIQYLWTSQVAIERSVSLYRQSLFVVVYPWSEGEAEDDGVRIFMTPGEAEQFNIRLIEALRELEIPFIELRQPDRKRRVEIIQDLVLRAQTEPGQKR